MRHSQSLDHPPAVKGLALFLIPVLRLSQATSGNTRSSASRINSLTPKGGRRLYAAKHLTEQPPINLSLADARGAKRRPHSA